MRAVPHEPESFLDHLASGVGGTLCSGMTGCSHHSIELEKALDISLLPQSAGDEVLDHKEAAFLVLLSAPLTNLLQQLAGLCPSHQQ